MSLNKVLAALLVIVFIIFTLGVVLIWSVGGNILDADAYVEALDEADFFQIPYQMIHDGDIPEVGGLVLIRGPLSVLSGDDLEAVARELAPPDWLRAQLERAIRDLLAVADTSEQNLRDVGAESDDVREPQSNDELPDLVISLSEVKARALGEPGDRALSIVVGALPRCAPDQKPLNLGSDTPICTPADVELNSFLRQLKTLLAPLVERVPDTYRVSWQPDSQDVLEGLQQAGRTLDQLRFVLLILVALSLALLGLIWVLAVRSPAEWLRWTGVPLLLLGLLVLLVALLAPRVVTWGLGEGGLWVAGNVPARIGQALEDAILGLTLTLFGPTQFVGMAMAVVGLLLVLVSPLFPDRRRSPLAR